MPTFHHQRARALLLALIALLLFFAACSSDDDAAGDRAETAEGAASGTFPGAPAATPPAGAPQGGTSGEAAAGGGTAADGEVGEPAGNGNGAVDPLAGVVRTTTHGRSMVYTADADVEVDDVAEASRLAQSAIAGLGGLLFAQETTTEPTTRSVLTFKVPPAAFAEALARLEALGSLRSQRIGVDDVTERVVDLQSRTTTAQVSVTRLRELLDGAGTLEEVAALEGQLLARETELERLRGQLRTVQDAVDLATINVVLRQATQEPAVAAQVTAYVGTDGGARCPGDVEVTVDEGEPVTVCVAVTNTGDVPLDAVQVRDPGLDLRAEDFTVVDGALASGLEPGGRLWAWATVEAQPGQRPSPQVSAVPVGDGGEAVAVRVRATAEAVPVDVLDDESLPGFADALATSWGALAGLGALLVLVMGAAVPFLWVVPAAVLVLRWHRRRRPQPTTA